MAIQLTSTQVFQNQINSSISQVAASINPQNPQGFAGMYARIYNLYFSYSGQTPDQVMTQLGTSAASVLAYLTALYTFLTSQGVTGIDTIPAYTANDDGTVKLS